MHSIKKSGCVSIVLFCLFSSTFGSTGQLSISCQKYYLTSVEPIVLNASSSSDLLSETNVHLETDCIFRCKLIACAIASWSVSSRICQLVILNDASVTLGPPLSHVRRVVRSEAGARVWKVDNFEDLVRKKQASVPNITLKYINTNTGRNGSIQQAVINITGCYRIEVAGARGGYQISVNMNGGRGAYASGNFNLTAGTKISIVVGQVGGPTNSMDAGAGGGGGSFVYVTSDGRLLIAAGGGGGACSYTYYKGKPGEAGVNGSNSDGFNIENIGFGGINGQPGYNNPNNTSSGRNHGGCGAGWLGKAVNPRRSSLDGDRGGSLADGWVGGQAGGVNTGDGGFGGGGGGGDKNTNGGAAGAGGGFSGGGAGVSSTHAGGGGGSYCAGLSCSAESGGNTIGDHGYVVLRLLIPFADTC